MGARRTIEKSGKARGGGELPLLCTPLVGRTGEALLGEVGAILAKGPDLIEWRIDFYEGIGRVSEAVELGRAIRAACGETPIILTRRSIREGGEKIPVGDDEVAALYEAACRAGICDYLDQELSSAPEHLRRARQASSQAGIGLIASFHDFQETPPGEVILGKFAEAQRLGADVAKVAVMPSGLEDVLTLVEATLRGRTQLPIPLIAMSMGPYGSLTRMFGWVFGSSVSFAVGKSSSAPGQVPIEDLRTVNAILRRSLGDAAP
jgi:3-dehydroquinate dehydratase-1